MCDCEDCRTIIMEARIALQDAELALRKARRRETLLEGQLQARQRQDPKRGDAEIIWDYWRSKLCPRARVFEGQRLKNVLKALESYTVDECKLVIDGCLNSTWHMKVGKTDLAYLFSDPSLIDEFIGKAQPARVAPAKPVLTVIDGGLEERYRDIRTALILAYGNDDWMSGEAPGEEFWPCPCCTRGAAPFLEVPLVIAAIDPIVRCTACHRHEHQIVAALAAKITKARTA